CPYTTLFRSRIGRTSDGVVQSHLRQGRRADECSVRRRSRRAPTRSVVQPERGHQWQQEQRSEQADRSQVARSEIACGRVHARCLLLLMLTTSHMAITAVASAHHWKAYDRCCAGVSPGGCQSRTYPCGACGSSSRIRLSICSPSASASSPGSG